MVLIDEKPPMLPPPPYSSTAALPPPPPPPSLPPAASDLQASSSLSPPLSPPSTHFASRNPFRHAVRTNPSPNPNSPISTSSPTSPRTPAPEYTSRNQYNRRRRDPPLTFTMLPSQLLLEIVYHTFPREDGRWGDEGRVERQRKTLYWLSVSLRLVNRALYIACMHVLRSTYLPAYSSLVKYPYTSDPFPHFSPGRLDNSPYTHTRTTPTPSPTHSTSSLSSNSSHHSNSNDNGMDIDGPLLPSLQRETSILDLFIALKVREDVWLDDSELHLEREESFRDLFDLMQPRARLEDLVRGYGVRKGVITLGAGGGRGEVEWARLGVAFSSRRVGLVLSPSGSGRKRTVVEVERTREEKLEVAARRLVRGLRDWVAADGR